MTPKKVLIPLAMIVLSAAILLAYNRSGMAVPASSPSPMPTRSASASSSAGSTATSVSEPTEVTQAAVPSVGDRAPLFTLPTVWGENVSLDDYRGNSNVVLLFYRTGG